MQFMDSGIQQPAIIATIRGEPFTEVPQDLFIPPDALEVLLDTFSGPLDLLLYLIRRQNFDIMNIPIVKITRQYMQYIELMEKCRLELAAEYLVMAAMLAEIKSRLLLPRAPTPESVDEEDPRIELVRRLQAYEQIKYAAALVDSMVRIGRDVFPVRVRLDNISLSKPHPDMALTELMTAMQNILVGQARIVSHSVAREVLSVRERMAIVLDRVHAEHYLEFNRLYLPTEGRMGLVVSLLAILELAKQSLLIIMQTVPYAPIYIKAVDG
jgi:segregation and condensation protein A